MEYDGKKVKNLYVIFSDDMSTDEIYVFFKGSAPIHGMYSDYRDLVAQYLSYIQTENGISEDEALDKYFDAMSDLNSSPEKIEKIRKRFENEEKFISENFSGITYEEFIDTTVEDFEEDLMDRRDMIAEGKESYSSDDICLVRVTDHFPDNSFLPALCNTPFLVKTPGLTHQVVFDILKEQEQNPSNERVDELIEEAHQYDVMSTQYRSSIHFCLNGVVSDHFRGTFDGGFVIIEPFKYHENDDNILSVRGEDTYFKDGINISSEATILVPIDKKDQIGETSLNVVYYKGDRDLATQKYLVDHGIVPELVGEHSLKNSNTSSLVESFIRSHDYEMDPHSLHPDYAEDDQKSTVLWDAYAKNFYEYLFEEAYHDENVRKEERETLLNGKYVYCSLKPKEVDENYQALRKVVEDIGLDKFKGIIDSYNTMMEEKLKNGEVPTNNQVLGIEPVVNSNSSGYGGKK